MRKFIFVDVGRVGFFLGFGVFFFVIRWGRGFFVGFFFFSWSFIGWGFVSGGGSLCEMS